MSTLSVCIKAAFTLTLQISFGCNKSWRDFDLPGVLRNVEALNRSDVARNVTEISLMLRVNRLQPVNVKEDTRLFFTLSFGLDLCAIAILSKSSLSEWYHSLSLSLSVNKPLRGIGCSGLVGNPVLSLPKGFFWSCTGERWGVGGGGAGVSRTSDWSELVRFNNRKHEPPSEKLTGKVAH